MDLDEIFSNAAKSEVMVKYYNHMKNGCSEGQKEVIFKHILLRNELYDILNIRRDIIDDFHHKKCILRKGKYIRSEQKTKIIYDKIIFMGLKQLGFDHLSIAFKCYFEHILFKDLGIFKEYPFDPQDLIDFYYHNSETSWKKNYDSKDWIFDDGLNFSEYDYELIEKFKRLIIDFYNKSIYLMIVYKSDSVSLKYLEEMIREKKRIERSFTKYIR